MADDFTDIHDELRSVACDLLAKERAGGAEVPNSLLAQAGWTGLEVPDELGGAGATFVEVGIILEEMGRAAAASGYLGGAVLSVGTLQALQSDTDRDALLGDVAAGAARTAVALTADHENASAGSPFAISATPGGLRLAGRAEFVPDAGGAERLLILADHPDGTPVIVAVPTDAVGLTVAAQPVLDETRRLGSVGADAVVIDESWVWRFAGVPADEVRRLRDRAAVAIACDSLGLSEAMLTATVSYAGVREQFGRPIGSFQAVKHQCADMLVQISVARRLVEAAVRALADADVADADVSRAASMAASMAKAYACEAAVDIAGTAMQLHGGIGYTWESGVHVYLKRAALNRSLFGSPAAHRRYLAERYG